MHGWARGWVSRGVAAAGLLAIMVCAGACQTAPRRAVADTATDIEVARPPDRFDPFPVVEVRAVRFDKHLAGYLKVKVDARSEEDIQYFEIYDDRFRVRGFQTEGGKTYRRRQTATKGFTYDPLGTYTRDDALRLLLGGKVDQEVVLSPVEAARSLAELPTGEKGASR